MDVSLLISNAVFFNRKFPLLSRWYGHKDPKDLRGGGISDQQYYR
jgi:hypothetical protein